MFRTLRFYHSFFEFLSTPSARRATNPGSPQHWFYLISIHALREEGDANRRKEIRYRVISIHALREEGDLGGCPRVAQTGKDFYPRPPRGGRRNSYAAAARHLDISIHALREEGDVSDVGSNIMGVLFLSTPSARRATAIPAQTHGAHLVISIHALREEGDCYSCTDPRRTSCDFYPRPPRGGRPPHPPQNGSAQQISIHALREEGDKGGIKMANVEYISIHALREEGDKLPSMAIMLPF